MLVKMTLESLEAWQESRSTTAQTRAWLLASAAAHLDSLAERAEATAE